MTKFENFSDMMHQYLAVKGYGLSVISDITQTSYSTESASSLCNSDLQVIDMDQFAKKGYRKIILPLSQTEDDAINTADAFLVNRNNEWYFIEFKDAKLSSRTAKYNILKKAYSNIYSVLDVLYSMQETSARYTEFDYSDPIRFIREHVKYILVFRAVKNPHDVIQMKNHAQKQENYLPEFMKRLQGYIYKEAYAMTEIAFEHVFLKNFAY